MATLNLTDDQLLALASFVERARSGERVAGDMTTDLARAVAELDTAAMDIVHSARIKRRTNYVRP